MIPPRFREVARAAGIATKGQHGRLHSVKSYIPSRSAPSAASALKPAVSVRRIPDPIDKAMILEPVKGWATTLDYYSVQINNQIGLKFSFPGFKSIAARRLEVIDQVLQIGRTAAPP